MSQPGDPNMAATPTSDVPQLPPEGVASEHIHADSPAPGTPTQDAPTRDTPTEVSPEAEDMPDVAADSFSIAFGDFRSGYLVVDRTGVRVLRDPYSAKPYVLFYTTKRVGGGVQNFDAIKVMKFAAA